MNLQAALDMLERQQLLRPTLDAEPALTFKHSLVQQTTYESVLLEDRRRLHRVVGQTLEALFPDRRAELAGGLADHFLRAEDKRTALHYAEIAGDQALAQFATAEAASHFAAAWDLAEQLGLDPEQLVSLARRRGRSLELAGRYPEALAVYLELEALGHATGVPALELAGKLGRAALYAFPTAVVDSRKALQIAQEGLDLARENHDPTSEARALWLLMGAQLGTSPQEAVRHGEAGIHLARRHGLREQLAFLLNDIQQSYAMTSRSDLALSALHQARPLWEELDNLPMLADNLASTSMHLLRVGRLDEARRDGQAALEISTRIGNRWGQAYSRWPIGTASLVLGELGPAIRAYRECVSYGDQAGFVVARFAGRAYLAFALTLAGASGLAESVLREANDLLGNMDEPLLQHIRVAEAWAASRAGNPEVAEPLLGSMLGEKYRNQLGEDPFLLPAAEIETILARREFSAALGRLETIEEVLKQMGVTVLTPTFDLFRGRALAALAQLDQARLALLRSLHGSQAIGVEAGLWEAEAELAGVADRLGDPQEADRLRSSARVHAAQVAEGLEDLGLQEGFLALSAVKALT